MTDVVADSLDTRFDFIYSVAVIHMPRILPAQRTAQETIFAQRIA
jgi:hypothetical protein